MTSGNGGCSDHNNGIGSARFLGVNTPMESELVYVGVVGGVFVAVSVVAGAVVTVRRHRRARSARAHDLGREAHRARKDARIALKNLIEIRKRAIESRKTIASAMENDHTGVMVRWRYRCDQDRKRIEELASEVSGTNVEFNGLSPEELKTRVVELTLAQGRIDDLTRQYRDDLRWDESQRKQSQKGSGAYRPQQSSTFRRK